jgi:hypothetical protein
MIELDTILSGLPNPELELELHESWKNTRSTTVPRNAVEDLHLLAIHASAIFPDHLHYIPITIPPSFDTFINA